MIRSFSDLEVYRRSQELYPKIVGYTVKFPRDGWHLKDQICRAANSIHANIAEGYGRSVAEFKMYLTRSLGSCNELISHIDDSINAKFGNLTEGTQLKSEYDLIGKKIYRLRENWI